MDARLRTPTRGVLTPSIRLGRSSRPGATRECNLHTTEMDEEASRSTDRHYPRRAMRRSGVVLLALCVVPLVLQPSLPVVGTASAEATTSVTATVRQVLSTSTRLVGHRTLACPSSDMCVLGTRPSARTTDGGMTWAPFELNAFDASGLDAVDCWSTQVCVGSGGFGTFRSSNGGVDWVSSQSNTLPSGVDDIDCTSATHCIATGVDRGLANAIWSTDDGGEVWVRRYVNPLGNTGRGHVSCASSTFCVVGSDRLFVASVDGGLTWRPVGLPWGSDSRAAALACAAPSMCTGVFSNGWIATSIDGGGHWTFPRLREVPFVPNSLACSSPSRCVGVGADPPIQLRGAAFTFDPTVDVFERSAVPAGVSKVDLVRCTGQQCVAIGSPDPYEIGSVDEFGASTVLRSSDGGTSWTLGRSQPPAERLTSVACSDAANCLAVGDVDVIDPVARLVPVVKRSSDGGQNWIVADTVPSGLGRLASVACISSGSTCIVTGTLPSNLGRTGIARSDDRGRTWEAATIDVPLANAGPVTCAAGGPCYVVGSNSVSGGTSSEWPTVIVRSTDSGLTWQVVASFSRTSGGTIGCQTASNCLLVLQSGVVTMWRTTDAGTSWTPVTMPQPATYDVSIAHCSLVRCIVRFGGFAVAPTFYVTVDAGATWAKLGGTQPTGYGAMGCDGDICVYSVADYHTTLYTSADGGLSWQYGGSPGGLRDIRSIVCNRPGTCLGVVPGRAQYGTAILGIDLSATSRPAASPGVVGLVPARLVETRVGPGLGTVDGLFQGGGLLGAGSTVAVRVAGRGGVVVGAGSAVLNVTVTGTVGAGFLTVYPCDQPRPVASSVNFGVGDTVANAVVAVLAGDGSTCVYSSAATHLIVDANGYVV
jgi:photosystem II stability/assembly factor-like uncharacterized protein